MQAEAERKDAYFVHVAEGVNRRALEDKHMVRFGPEVRFDKFSRYKRAYVNGGESSLIEIREMTSTPRV